MAGSPEGNTDELALRKDVRRGLQGRSKEVAQVLYNLAKTARSFGFYAKNNEAIQIFLTELADGFDAYLREHGMIRLAVGPSCFIYEDQEVYHDADREWGMPFRLYRDGVRTISFKPGLGRSQLEELLDILAKRATTGREAEEEDMVTLLWQRAFENITYTAVEGFTHDLHAGDGGGDEEGGGADTGEAIPRMMDRISGNRETILQERVQRGRASRSYVDEEAERLLEQQSIETGKKREDLTEEELERLSQGGGGGGGGGGRRGGGGGGGGEGGDSTGDPRGLGGDGPSVEGGNIVGQGASGDGSGFTALEDVEESLYPGFPGYQLPLRGGLVEVQFSKIDFDEIDELRRQLDEERALGLIHLLDYCFELCVQAPGFFGPEDFRPMLKPIRRYLLRHGDLSTFDHLLRYLRKIAQGGVYPEHLSKEAEAMLAECAGMDSVAGLVAVASGDNEAEDLAWDVLQALLPNLSPDELLEMLGHSMSEHMANILAGTLVSRTGSDLSLYRAAIAGTSVPTALAALRCLGAVRTTEAVALVHQAMKWLDPVIRQAVVRIAGRVPFSDECIQTMKAGLEDGVQDVRDETIRAIDVQGAPALAPVLFRWFEETGYKLSDEITRHRCATLVAELDPQYATKVLSEKIDTGLRSKMGGFVRGDGMNDWNRIAVEGLAVAATPAAIEKLRDVRTKGSDEFRDLVTKRLVDARRKASA